MKKKDLLEFIERAKRVEEDAVQSLSKHVSAATQWSGLEPEENAHILNVLTTLARDSEKHSNILDKIKERVMKEDKNVY